jgi:hypothetical protein
MKPLHVERSDGVASTGNNRHVAPATYRQRHARQVPLPPRPDPQPAAGAGSGVRVVYNDALYERERAHQTSKQLSDTEVQRRVITLAKQTPERAWLTEVASVVLVQACQDARRAYRNWFDSQSGKRHGRRVGHPRFRTKHGRQSIRLTRNGFALHGTRLYVAKVGTCGCVGHGRSRRCRPASA